MVDLGMKIIKNAQSGGSLSVALLDGRRLCVLARKLCLWVAGAGAGCGEM